MHRKSTYTAMKSIVVKAGVYNLEDWSDDIITRNLAGAAIHESYNASTLASKMDIISIYISFMPVLIFHRNLAILIVREGMNKF